MRCLMLLVLLLPLVTLSVGCSGGDPSAPKPKNDPNWVDTTNPSKIVVPDSMKKGGPAGKTAPAPSGQK
jgi:hypothetical protein